MPYGFVSPGGMAGNAIQQFLMQREAENRQRMLDEITQQEASQRRNQFGLDQMQRDLENQRVAKFDQMEENDRATAKRAELNQTGVRGLMADAMTEGPVDDAAARTLGIMAFREGMAPPAEVTQRQEDARIAQDRSAGLADYEARAMIDATVDGQTADPWRSSGAGSIFHAGTGEFRQAPDTGGGGGGFRGAADDDMNVYTARGQSRLLTAITDLEPMIGPSTVGTWRARGSRAVQGITPGEANDTVDFDAALKQITALIGFDELNQMRQASPTGGALGQVSERELMYLQSVAGTLDPNQSEPAFRRQLQKVKEEIERVVNYGLNDAGGGRGAGPGPSADGWQDAGNGFRVRVKGN